LFSDGLVNAGVTSHDAIFEKVVQLRMQQGVSTSAFGVGGDYDRRLMTGIAEAGHGDFFFIEGQRDMEKVVRVATSGFRGVMATGTELRLTPVGGVELRDTYGHEPSEETRSGTWSFRLGDLCWGEQRVMLVDVHVPPLGGTAEILEYTLAFGDSEQQSVRGRVQVQAVEPGAPVASPNAVVEHFRRLQQELAREGEVERLLLKGDAASAAREESILEARLGEIAASCTSALGPDERVCQRISKAHARTKRSREMLSRGDNEAIAAEAYNFKRRVNTELKEAYDEL